MKQVDRAVVEFANETLYLAFNGRDLREMDRLWADEHSTVCIHPGWQPLRGKEEIMASWRSIFGAQDAGDLINCHQPVVMSLSGMHLVTCYEQLGDGWLVATNCFIEEAGRLRICYHQAGQCMEAPDIDLPAPTLQ